MKLKTAAYIAALIAAVMVTGIGLFAALYYRHSMGFSVAICGILLGVFYIIRGRD